MRPLPRLALLIAFVPALATPALRADTASPRLARYRKPVDEAVDRALAWLAKAQARNGSFRGSYGTTTAVIGLAGMAFLSKGYTPGSGPYGDTINRAINAVLGAQRKNGCLDSGRGRGGMYSHCIGTLLLSEVSGMVDPARQKKIDEALPRALKVILSAQQIKKHPMYQGGWRYKPNSRDSDISVSGWALMALRSARLNGAPVGKDAIDDAVKFILRCRHEPSGGFRYQPRRSGAGLARTGVALLCLELTGHHGEEPARKAGDFVLKSIQRGRFLRGSHPFYTLYYCSQGMFQLGDKYWEEFAERMFKHMLESQHHDGYWKGGRSQPPAYATSMTVLALTVTYRQLPIYQR
jgi:hypothetical protein